MCNILIVSHNPLSNLQSNGKTISSILSCYEKDKLAQLYFTLDIPDFDICDNFFRITDLDVLKNFFMLNKNIGMKITQEYIKKNKDEKKNYHSNLLYNFIRKLFVSKVSIMTTIRDYVWKNSYYYSDIFEKWIEQFKPDLIFFQSSNCCFAFEFVYKICTKKNIRLIMETTDDYLSYKKWNIFYNYNVYKLRKCYKKLNSHCDLILPISDSMGKYYYKMFPNKYYTVMNSVDVKNIKYKFNKNNMKLLYAGNLGLGRWETLYKLAKIINHYKPNISIEIYSLERPTDIVINKLNEFSCCSYGGSLNYLELEKKRKEADVLLHVESFSKRNRHLTRYSISTKIPELMNSSRMILAIGPRDIASIEYLINTKTAFVISSDNIKTMEEKIDEFININNYEKYVNNCYNTVKTNHNINNVHDYIKKFLGDNYD